MAARFARGRSEKLLRRSLALVASLYGVARAARRFSRWTNLPLSHQRHSIGADQHGRNQQRHSRTNRFVRECPHVTAFVCAHAFGAAHAMRHRDKPGSFQFGLREKVQPAHAWRDCPRVLSLSLTQSCRPCGGCGKLRSKFPVILRVMPRQSRRRGLGARRESIILPERFPPAVRSFSLLVGRFETRSCSSLPAIPSPHIAVRELHSQ